MTSTQQSDWAGQPINPDPNQDLGYDLAQLDVVPVDDGDSDQHVLLPTDDAMLKLDAFLIVPGSLLYALAEHR